MKHGFLFCEYETIPALLDRASQALVNAKDSAEVLEARDMARVAYDAAKSAGRLAKAKKAHDTVLAQVYRAQADALLIESRAKMRLAEEYDAAQERGEVRGSRERTASSPEAVGAADIGLTHKDIHEARQIRDAEAADPGITQRTLNEIVERGDEPTKAKLNREIIKQKPVAKKIMDPKALWLWGRLATANAVTLIRVPLRNQRTHGEVLRLHWRRQTPQPPRPV